jgi:hypothetical protein
MKFGIFRAHLAGIAEGRHRHRTPEAERQMMGRRRQGDAPRSPAAQSQSNRKTTRNGFLT